MTTNLDNQTGMIFAVKRFEVHDGPGIRTTVFLKGCPLRCIWCHNPEGLTACPTLAFDRSRCEMCGACTVCAAHRISETEHNFDRSICAELIREGKCMRCDRTCAGNGVRPALRLYGEKTGVKELMPLLTADRPFFGTNGGVTLSGGEPLLQPDFSIALLKALHTEGIHTALDTSGYADPAVFRPVMRHADLLLFDVKAVDETVHIRCTGVSNRLILQNLETAVREGKAIEVRVPVVPGYNADELPEIERLLASLRITAVKKLPYHDYARDKYAALGLKYEIRPNKS